MNFCVDWSFGEFVQVVVIFVFVVLFLGIARPSDKYQERGNYPLWAGVGLFFVVFLVVFFALMGLPA